MKKVIKIISLFLGLVLFSACNQEVKIISDNKPAFLSVNINDEEGRTVLPPTTPGSDYFDTWIFSGIFGEETKNFGTFSSSKELREQKFEVEKGTWTFVLEARRNNTVYYATKNLEIVAGENKISLYLSMQSLDLENGTGGLSFKLKLPAAVVKATLVLSKDIENPDGTVIDTQTFSVEDGEIYYEKLSIPAGNYFIKVFLYDSRDRFLNFYHDTAIVIDNKISTGETTISQVNEITTQRTITYASGVYTFKEGADVETSFDNESTEKILLPTADDIDSILDFQGWYLNSELTGDAVTEINPFGSNNITLYPKWGNEFTGTIDQLKTVINEFKSGEVILHIEDESSSLLKSLKTVLSKNTKVQYKLDLTGCTKLTSFTSDLAYSENIISLTIPENVVSISTTAFNYMTNLEELHINCIKAAVPSSPSYSRVGSESGVTVYFGNKVEYIPDYLFYRNYLNVKEIIFPEDSVCTTVGKYAFYNNSDIKNINLSESVTTVCEYAFSNATNLESIGENVSLSVIKNQAFYYCNKLKEINIAEDCKALGDSVFYNCSALTKINLYPEMTISSSTFRSTSFSDIYFAGTFDQWCELIDSIPSSYSSSYPNSNTNGVNLYLNGTLLKEAVINSSEVNISDKAFQNLTIESITIGEAVSVIKSSFPAFPKLKNIYYNAVSATVVNYPFSSIKGDSDGVTVTVGNKVQALPNNIFRCSTYSTNNISKLIFEENSVCASIGQNAFASCSKLTEVYIPASVTTFYSNPFSDNLEKVYYEGSFEDWCSKITFTEYDSGPLHYEADLYVMGDQLVTDVTFPEDTTAITINKYALGYCTSIKTVTIPENVESINTDSLRNLINVETLYYNSSKAISFKSSGTDYFSGMGRNGDGLKVVFGDKVTKIPDYFAKTGISYYVSEVVFAPNSTCTEIGNYAFEDCSSITRVELPSSLKKIGRSAFAARYSSTKTKLEEVIFDSEELTVDSFDVPFSGCGAGSSEGGFEIKIGAGVKKIPKGIFKNSYVKKVTFANNSVCSVIEEDAFSGALKTEEFILPKTVKTIGRNAFSYANINIVRYPGTTDEWFAISLVDYTSNPCNGGSDFYIGGNLVREINFDSSITTIPSGIYAGVNAEKITIPSQIIKIEEGAFRNCRKLKEFVYNAVDAKTSGSFYNRILTAAGRDCDGTTVKIGSGVKQIPDYLFDPDSNSVGETMRTNIVRIEFAENGVCSLINKGAFSHNYSLKEITIPAYITTIKEDAFRDCPNLVNVYYLGTQTDWEKISFTRENASPCCNGAVLYCKGNKITSVVIPEGTTEVPEGVYSGCVAIESVSLPSTLKTLKSYCFINCT